MGIFFVPISGLLFENWRVLFVEFLKYVVLDLHTSHYTQFFMLCFIVFVHLKTKGHHTLLEREFWMNNFLLSILAHAYENSPWCYVTDLLSKNATICDKRCCDLVLKKKLIKKQNSNAVYFCLSLVENIYALPPYKRLEVFQKECG